VLRITSRRDLQDEACLTRHKERSPVPAVSASSSAPAQPTPTDPVPASAWVHDRCPSLLVGAGIVS
jgi:hypothetical protein